MRAIYAAIAGVAAGLVTGMVAMGIIVAESKEKESANLATINGVKIRIEDANKIAADVKKHLAKELRSAGEDKMRGAALYENKEQWGGCSNYLEASALFDQASIWGDDVSAELRKTAFDAGKRACDRWYNYEKP